MGFTMTGAAAVAQSRQSLLPAPPDALPTAAVESTLMEGGRFLLTFSMALFVAYLLFITGAIVIASMLGRVWSAIRTSGRGTVVASGPGRGRTDREHHDDSLDGLDGDVDDDGSAGIDADRSAEPAHAGGVVR